MTFGGIIAVFIAIWVYRTAMEAKTGNAIAWVAASFVMYLVLQLLVIYFNSMIIDFFDRDLSVEYETTGGLNSRDNIDTAGLQSGTFGTLIGVTFELATWLVPFFVIAALRLLLMLKQPFSFTALFGGIKEMFIAIGQSFKVKDSN